MTLPLPARRFCFFTLSFLALLSPAYGQFESFDDTMTLDDIMHVQTEAFVEREPGLRMLSGTDDVGIEFSGGPISIKYQLDGPGFPTLKQFKDMDVGFFDMRLAVDDGLLRLAVYDAYETSNGISYGFNELMMEAMVTGDLFVAWPKARARIGIGALWRFGGSDFDERIPDHYRFGPENLHGKQELTSDWIGIGPSINGWLYYSVFRGLNATVATRAEGIIGHRETRIVEDFYYYTTSPFASHTKADVDKTENDLDAQLRLMISPGLTWQPLVDSPASFTIEYRFYKFFGEPTFVGMDGLVFTGRVNF